MIAGENDVTGVDFTLERVNGKIEGDVALSGGPAVDVTVTAYDALTGAVGGDGPQVVSGGTGHFEIVTVVDAAYYVEATALGYVEQKVDGRGRERGHRGRRDHHAPGGGRHEVRVHGRRRARRSSVWPRP